MAEYEVLLDAKAELGEGPVWDAKKKLVYWLDIFAKIIHIYDPSSGKDRTITAPRLVACVANRKAGGWVAACQGGFFLFDPEKNKWTLIGDPEADQPGNRPNDGKADPAGRFWAGTMSFGGDKPGVGSVYRLDADRSVHKMFGGCTISNGMAWDVKAGKMYYIDTPTKEVAVYDYDNKTGDIANRKVAVKVPDDMGYPDGMNIDAEGKIWVAHWGGGCVCRWDPKNGKLMRRIDLPTPQPSSCVFGGPNLDELYVTSARLALDEATLKKQPLSGALFRVKPGVQGTPTDVYAG